MKQFAPNLKTQNSNLLILNSNFNGTHFAQVVPNHGVKMEMRRKFKKKNNTQMLSVTRVSRFDRESLKSLLGEGLVRGAERKTQHSHAFFLKGALGQRLLSGR